MDKIKKAVSEFLERYGWRLAGVLLLLVVAMIAWNYYSGEQEKRWQCLQRIEYVSAGFYRLDEDRRFKTQDEAIRFRPLAFSDYRSEDIALRGQSPTEKTPSDLQVTFENQMGFGEALWQTLVQTFGYYILLLIVVFGGFRLINPHLKKTPSLRVKQIGVIAVLFFVVAVFAEILLRTTGISLF